jgi:hypothetical protein
VFSPALGIEIFGHDTLKLFSAVKQDLILGILASENCFRITEMITPVLRGEYTVKPSTQKG